MLWGRVLRGTAALTSCRGVSAGSVASTPPCLPQPPCVVAASSAAVLACAFLALRL